MDTMGEVCIVGIMGAAGVMAQLMGAYNECCGCYGYYGCYGCFNMQTLLCYSNEDSEYNIYWYNWIIA